MAPALNKLGFCSRFIYLRQQLIDFGGRPYLPAIYAVTNRNLVLRCSRQVEKSTFLANTVIFEACTRPAAEILVVCPREQQARRFAHDRLLPAIEQSPLVRRVLFGDGRRKSPLMELKFNNGGRVKLLAAFDTADSCRGVSADLLLVDEFQDLAAGHLPVLLETLSHATNPRTILVGTPKSVENQLEGQFTQSTANEWQVPCEQCRHGVVLDEQCLGPQGIVCPTCQRSLNPTLGEWVPRNPEARWGEGFCVNHLMVPWLNYDEILDRQRRYDLAQFKNEVLGLSSTTGDQVVTRAELEACCGELPMARSSADIPAVGQGQLVAGIDWGGGGTSRTVLVLGYMRSDYCFQVCRFERFDSQDDPSYVLDQLALRCQQFRVQYIAADGGGNGNVQNRLLIEKLGAFENLYGIYYSVSDHEPQRRGLLTKWTVDRTATIGFLFTRVKRQQICFPRIADCGTFLDEFACEVAEYDDINRAVRYTHPATQQDDALHATNYALLVATRAFQAAARFAE